jgi:hypothetical protein
MRERKKKKKKKGDVGKERRERERERTNFILSLKVTKEIRSRKFDIARLLPFYTSGVLCAMG